MLEAEPPCQDPHHHECVCRGSARPGGRVSLYKVCEQRASRTLVTLAGLSSLVDGRPGTSRCLHYQPSILQCQFIHINNSNVHINNINVDSSKTSFGKSKNIVPAKVELSTLSAL